RVREVQRAIQGTEGVTIQSGIKILGVYWLEWCWIVSLCVRQIGAEIGAVGVRGAGCIQLRVALGTTVQSGGPELRLVRYKKGFGWVVHVGSWSGRFRCARITALARKEAQVIELRAAIGIHIVRIDGISQTSRILLTTEDRNVDR